MDKRLVTTTEQSIPNFNLFDDYLSVVVYDSHPKRTFGSDMIRWDTNLTKYFLMIASA